jgi:eukaryotic-like serine/threonine-protein kinase
MSDPNVNGDEPKEKSEQSTLLALGGVAPSTEVVIPDSHKDTIAATSLEVTQDEKESDIENAATLHYSKEIQSGVTQSDLSNGDSDVSHTISDHFQGLHTILPKATLENGSVKWIHTKRTRLEILEQIGEGGVGEVLTAMDHDIGRRVAIKKIKSNMKSPEMVLRFIEEIRTVGRLEHPNIIPIHDVGVDEGGDYYFIMKYIEGETLEMIIDKLKSGDKKTLEKYPFERRMEIFRGVLEALHYSHSKKVLHRDIKPANVMVGPFGEVLLMDWGIAKQLGDSSSIVDELVPREVDDSDTGDGRFWRTKVGGLIGTPAYMSPEQAQGKEVDERSDTYSLMMLLQEFLTLSHYLKDKKTMAEILSGVVNESPSMMSYSQSKYQSPVPMDMVWFVKKGLKKDKSKRYQSMGEILNRLDLMAQGIFPINCHITFMKRVNSSINRFVDRHPMVSTLGLIASVVTPMYLLISAL